MGAKLLQDVRQDLADVVQVCEGKKKQTNYLRTLINELVKGVLGSWAAGLCSGQVPQVSNHSLCAGFSSGRWAPHLSSFREAGQRHLLSFYAGPSNIN